MAVSFAKIDSLPAYSSSSVAVSGCVWLHPPNPVHAVKLDSGSFVTPASPGGVSWAWAYAVFTYGIFDNTAAEHK